MQKWIILIVILIIVILSIFIVSNVNVETEYTPETEVEEVELRKTIVTLYFKDKNSDELARETRFVDSKTLLKAPYDEILNLLMSGPENNNYEKIIPDNVSIINTSFENGCVTINFSKELKEANLDEKQKSNLFYSILNTLTELTEVSDIKILIENDEYMLNDSNINTTSENTVSNVIENAIN